MASRPSFLALAGLLAVMVGAAPLEASGGDSAMGPSSRATVKIALTVAPRVWVVGGEAREPLENRSPALQTFRVCSNRGVGTYSLKLLHAAGAAVGNGPGEAVGLELELAAASADGPSHLVLRRGAELKGWSPAVEGGCSRASLEARPTKQPAGALAAPRRGAQPLLLVAPD